MDVSLITFLLCLEVFAFGQSNCEQCGTKFKAGDFSKAKGACILASHDGDPLCQTYLGIIYLSESNMDSAKIWFEKSAHQGNPIGQNGMGYLYQNGFGGLPKDLNKANEWFLKSAEQGNADSQFWLGENLFLSGNKNDGYKWTQKAALSGSADAQFNLGAMLQNGDGVEQDASLANVWFIISATNGNEKSKSVIDKLKARILNEQFQEYIRKTEDFIKENPHVLN